MIMLNVAVKDATGVQINAHIKHCSDCRTDRILSYRRSLVRKGESATERRYRRIQVRERLQQMHRGSI